MTTNNRRLVLPSGVVAVRYTRSIEDGGGFFVLHSGSFGTQKDLERLGYAYAFHGRPILLPADVEALYADLISGDGGRELLDPADHARGLCSYCGQPRNSSLCQKAHP